MAFDGFVLKGVTAELKNCLLEGKIQKVYQPNKNEILLGIYCNGISYALCINVSSNFYAAYLTTSKKENPLSPPNFCMFLRKYLIGSKIASIYSLGLERIMIIELNGTDENYMPTTQKLVIELMGKHSNILLLNEKDIILDSLKHFSLENGSNRNIMPKYQYVFPTSCKIDLEDYALLENNLPKDISLSNFFANEFIGVSKQLVRQCISNLAIQDILNLDNYNTVVKYLLALKQNLDNGNAKCIYLADSNDYTLTSCFETQNLQINFFLDDYYTKKESEEQFIIYHNQLLSFIAGKLKKISKKLTGIEEKLKECAHLEEYKLYGELITSHLYEISDTHLETITLHNYYTNSPIHIPLDIALSPADNAKKYFKKYHKLKNTIEIVQEQKIELEKEITYLESIVYEIQAAQSINDLNLIYEEIETSFLINRKQQNNHKKFKKKKLTKEQKMIEPIVTNIDGFKVLIGKNNHQNDELTFKIANKNDIWFHVKNLQGSHVILVTNGKTPAQETLNKCAAVAAYHSKAMQSSNVPIDYTFVKYVKKLNKAKPGMVIYTSQQTINVNPQKETST